MTISDQLHRSRALAAYNRYKPFLRHVDESFENGRTWYFRAHERLWRLSHKHAVSVETVAGIAAALSPLTTWGSNLEALRAVLEGDQQRLDFHHGLKGNQRKAKEILQGTDPLDVLGGQKVTAFYRSLLLEPGAVCVDSHMWNAVERFGLSSASPTGNAARAIRTAVRMLASEFYKETFQIQAIVWCKFRQRIGHNSYQF